MALRYEALNIAPIGCRSGCTCTLGAEVQSLRVGARESVGTATYALAAGRELAMPSSCTGEESLAGQPT